MESWEMLIDFGLIAGMSLLGIIIFFLVKSKVDFSRKLLIAFFASAFFFLLYYYGFLHRSRVIGGVAVLFGNGMGYLLGPTVMTLLKSLFIPKEKLIKPYVKTLIPYFIIILIINVPYFLAMVFGFLKPYQKFMVRHDFIIITIENLYFLYYLILTKKLYFRLKRIFEENYSSQEINNLRWFSHLINGFIFIVIADNLCTVYELIFPVILWNIGTIIAFVLIGLYVFLGYKGMFQSRILIPEYLLEKLSYIKEGKNSPTLTDKTSEEEPGGQQKKSHPGQLSSFSDDEINDLKIKLIQLLEIEKLYLDESLNLTELSEKLGVSNKKLSELLNQHLNTNFYNLINEYRVNEVKMKILAGDAEKYNLLSIAFDSGFQSKASFHRIFKQKVGVSPSAYRNQISMKNRD